MAPVACIGPTGYYGSIWWDDFPLAIERWGLEQLFVLPLEIAEPIAASGPQIRAWVPRSHDFAGFVHWLDGKTAQQGEPYISPQSLRVSVWLKRLNSLQDALSELLGKEERLSLEARLTIEVTPSGKHKGENQIRATVGSQTIGLLPAQYRAEEEGFFQSVEEGRSIGTAEIFRFPERIGVRCTVEKKTR